MLREPIFSPSDQVKVKKQYRLHHALPINAAKKKDNGCPNRQIQIRLLIIFFHRKVAVDRSLSSTALVGAGGPRSYLGGAGNGGGPEEFFQVRSSNLSVLANVVDFFLNPPGLAVRDRVRGGGLHRQGRLRGGLQGADIKKKIK